MISRRRSIAELAYYIAENGGVDNPVAHAVTEGRIKTQYSHGWGTSCVEPLDCCAFAAGCREGAINRDEHLGRRMQRDLGWFLSGSEHSGTIIRRPTLGHLKPGDYLGYDFDRGGHACIFLGRDGDRAITCDYGQSGGGGRLYRCSIATAPNGMLLLRGRAVWAMVDVDTLEFTEPSLTVGEWCESHMLPVTPWTPLEYL